MADRLYVAYWLRGFAADNMLRHFEAALRKFPFSKLAEADSLVRLFAVSFSEPPVLEMPVPTPPNPAALVAAGKQFLHGDVCLQLETFWDLWGRDPDWKLRPARVQVACFGPDFEDVGDGENLRIDFGLETGFLPVDGEGMPMVRANIQSLLRLVHDLDEVLPVERRQLRSESGENFAAKLQEVLRERG
jgi:hypothetical protein